MPHGKEGSYMVHHRIQVFIAEVISGARNPEQVQIEVEDHPPATNGSLGPVLLCSFYPRAYTLNPKP